MTQVADSERVQYMNMAFEMIQEYPFLGVGFNNFQLYSEPTQEAFPGYFFHSKVHNVYLLIASEIGLIGGVFFLLFLWVILKTAWLTALARSNNSHLYSNNQEMFFLLATFSGIMLIGVFDFYLIHTPHGRMLFFGFAAFLYAMSQVVKQQKHSENKSHIP